MITITTVLKPIADVEEGRYVSADKKQTVTAYIDAKKSSYGFFENIETGAFIGDIKNPDFLVWAREIKKDNQTLFVEV